MSNQGPNGTCPPNAVPDTELKLKIPDGISWVAIPGQNASVPWMVNCCDPYPVSVVEKCWLWCEIDPAVAKNTSDGGVVQDFQTCLSMNHRDLNQSNGLLYHRNNAAARPSAQVVRSVMAALVTSWVVTTVISVG